MFECLLWLPTHGSHSTSRCTRPLTVTRKTQNGLAVAAAFYGQPKPLPDDEDLQREGVPLRNEGVRCVLQSRQGVAHHCCSGPLSRVNEPSRRYAPALWAREVERCRSNHDREVRPSFIGLVRDGVSDLL